MQEPTDVEARPRPTHRADTGRSYRGLKIHAAQGVHEHACEIATRLVNPGGRILDVGSGSGALAARLTDAGFAVTGADLDVSDYRAGTPVVEWDASGPRLPADFAPGTFDAVCAVEVLEHLENPRQALRNFYDALRPGGLLIVSTPNVTHPRSRLKFLLRGEPSYFGRDEYFTSGHRTILPGWMLRLHVEEAGFSSVTLDYAGKMGLPTGQAIVFKLLEPLFAALRWMPSPRTGDGCVTFALARKPRQPVQASS